MLKVINMCATKKLLRLSMKLQTLFCIRNAVKMLSLRQKTRRYDFKLFCYCNSIHYLTLICIQGMVWSGMERKFRYGVWKMPEWNGMEDFKNGMEGNLPYQFHTKFCALYLRKNIYRCRVVTSNIVTEVFIFNYIYGYYLSTNRGSLVVYITQTVYVMHHSKYIAICSH